MAYGKKWSGKKKSNGVSTGLFKSKKPGLCLGYIKGEYFDKLMSLLGTIDPETGIVLFLNRQDDPVKPFYIVLDKLTPQEDSSGGYKKKTMYNKRPPREEERDDDENGEEETPQDDFKW